MYFLESLEMTDRRLLFASLMAWDALGAPGASRFSSTTGAAAKPVGVERATGQRAHGGGPSCPALGAVASPFDDTARSGANGDVGNRFTRHQWLKQSVAPGGKKRERSAAISLERQLVLPVRLV